VSTSRDVVQARVDEVADEVLRVSRAVHRFAEPAFAEHRSSALLAAVAARHGLRVRRGVGGLPTAVVAEAGHRGPIVAIFCEYDALPGLGHACGHNVIAAAGLGAGIALARLAERGHGRVRLIGSPAEEGGGGKVLLARAGVLRGVRAAMLVHPNAFETARPRIVAAVQLSVRTLGRSTHASLFPERGVNALDGLVLGYTGLWASRASLPPGGQVHGVLLGGGRLPGVIPDRADARFLLRAPTSDALGPVTDHVLRSLRAGASAVGAGLRVRRAGPAYAELRTDPWLAARWEEHVRALGRRPRRLAPGGRTGSSDLGNVGRLVPAIHPMVAISDDDVVPHTRRFASAAIGPRADLAVLDGATALALTSLDVWERGDDPLVTEPLRRPSGTARGAISAASGR
jgi:amidohydrolase